MLEFQDPPEFGYGTDEANTTFFGDIFGGVIGSLVALNDLPGAVMAAGASGGAADPNPQLDGTGLGDMSTLPWAIASIIWKDGNKYAKDWVGNVHRLEAQNVGYAIDFTFRGHYKAVECDLVMSALETNGLTQDNFDSSSGTMFLNPGLMKEFWNTFSDMEDKSPQFAAECASQCDLAPCPDTIDNESPQQQSPTVAPALSSTNAPANAPTTSNAVASFDARALEIVALVCCNLCVAFLAPNWL